MTLVWGFSATPAGRVLRVIQSRGRATVKDLASELGVTSSAVRLHLSQLQARGVVRADKVHVGVGRPHYVYSVTSHAHNLFPTDYADLARLLLDEVASRDGADALQDVLGRVGDGLASMYRDRVAGRALADRVAAWAELLDQRGVVVHIERAGDGFLLREYGCPYHGLAGENRAVCEMERQVMARLLESGVSLTECVLDGYGGCQFAVQAGQTKTDEEQ